MQSKEIATLSIALMKRCLRRKSRCSPVLRSTEAPASLACHWPAGGSSYSTQIELRRLRFEHFRLRRTAYVPLMIGDLDQPFHGNDLDVRARPGGFRTTRARSGRAAPWWFTRCPSHRSSGHYRPVRVNQSGSRGLSGGSKTGRTKDG